MSVGALFSLCIMNVDFKEIKIDYKFFCPQGGKVVQFLFEKRLKNYVCRIRPLFGKKTVSLTCWAGLMSVGTLFSSS